jgi:malonate-semialdehyde dehydrogenase (acetylating)/methylmalonate-semialdehyde dehydrogenase
MSASIEVLSPWDGLKIGEVQAADKAAVDRVVNTATAAAAAWGQATVKDRVQVLFRFKALVERDMKSLSELVSRENGKTLGEAEAELRKGLEVVEYATALPQELAGSVLEVSGGVDCRTLRQPLGVVAGVTPFNFPAMVPMWMFPIALGCGNAFILKPSDQVPLTPLRLAELLEEAGLPKGVFQVAQGGKETVEALLEHSGIQALAFVGSTPVAKAVYQRGIAAGKRVLALGGAKNHLVVMPDADPDLTPSNIVASAMGCAGQRCMAASVLVAIKGSDAVLDRMVDEARKVRTGIDIGAVISAAAKDRIHAHIDRAEKEGAELRLDGRNPDVPGKKGGFYVGPTVLDRIPQGAACVSDEIFGPVLSVLRVEDLDQALALVNASPYGNAASIYTRSGGAARYFSKQANAGMVGVNIGVPVPREPFSFGGWNASKFGLGDITGEEAIHFWTKLKKITEKWPGQSGAAAWAGWH